MGTHKAPARRARRVCRVLDRTLILEAHQRRHATLKPQPDVADTPQTPGRLASRDLRQISHIVTPLELTVMLQGGDVVAEELRGRLP